MSIAIISDVHANLEALTVVLEDIEKVRKRYEIEEIYCLGDIVNYGPNPKECVALVRKHCSVVLRGNHDEAVGTGNEKLFATFNDLPQAGVKWTRERLSKTDRDYLAGLPYQHVNNGLAAVHGTLCSKLMKGDYDYTGDPQKNLEFASFTLYCSKFSRDGDDVNLQRCFDSLQDVGSKVCVVGHVQMAEGYTQRFGTRTIEPISLRIEKQGAAGIGVNLKMMQRYIFDVGAVGQPRDNDARASYGIYSRDRFIIRRVPYDVLKTQDKINKSGLPKMFGVRLPMGR